MVCASCRLGTRHDALLPGSAYVALGLMLQDPVAGVREVFGRKLRRQVLRRQAQGSLAGGVEGAGGWLPTKYAAMLPLAGEGQSRGDIRVFLVWFWLPSRRLPLAVMVLLW